MINFSAARRLVEEELAKISKGMPLEDKLVIDHSLTMEKEFGWVFFYNSEAYLLRKDEKHRLLGNAPIIVDKISGQLYFLGTAKSVDDYIEEFLRERR